MVKSKSSHGQVTGSCGLLYLHSLVDILHFFSLRNRFPGQKSVANKKKQVLCIVIKKKPTFFLTQVWQCSWMASMFTRNAKQKQQKKTVYFAICSSIPRLRIQIFLED